jgi:DNA processing protein
LRCWAYHRCDPADAWGRKRRWKDETALLSEAQQQSWREFREKWTPGGYAEHLASQGVAVLGEHAFPDLLRQIDDPPVCLFMKGNVDCLRPVHIAVVGSRTPTRYGQYVTQRLVSGFIDADCAIVSGFMVGIDFQSHAVAQHCGGRSIGVLGYGFGEIYPRQLTRSAEEFLASGNLFVTEYAPGMPPIKGQFPQRNRIVAGLSAATVVVEAKESSGSLITAQYAIDNGRVVGAVPGPVDSLYSRGTHLLLRQGAVLVENSSNVLEEIGGISPKMTEKGLKTP